MLSEFASSLTDLALGLVAVWLAIQLRNAPGVGPYWRQLFWWVGAASPAIRPSVACAARCRVR